MQACCVYHLHLSMRWGFILSFCVFINLVSLTVSTPDKASDGIGPKKGSRGNLIGQGWNKERWQAQVLFEALQKKTLYQHWRQFTPQFIGGAINRLVWGFCNRYSPPTPLGLFTPSPSNIVSNSTTSNITPQYCFQEQEQDAGGGNKGLEIG